MLVGGPVRQRNRPEQAEAETGVGQQSLAVHGHHDHRVRPGGQQRIAHPSQPTLDLIPEPLQGRREQRAVLEAVPAATAADELGLDRCQVDARVPVQQDVDVVEGERPHVGLVQCVQGRPRHRSGHGTAELQPGQISIQIELVDLPRALGGHRRLLHAAYFFSRPPAEPAGSLDSAAMKASCGTSTRPTIFIRFLPSFCFSSSLRLRVMSPP